MDGQDRQSMEHLWDVTPLEAEAIQLRLAPRVVRTDKFLAPIRFIAGVDVAYDPHHDRVCAGVVILDAESLQTVETQTVVCVTGFPYVPGLFAFRELPSVLEAFGQLRQLPDLVICDGHGIAHPRRCGMASHLGLLLDLPTIGCGKTRHVGEFTQPAAEQNSFSPLIDGNEVIGSALRTQDNVNPLFVSIGHRVSLDTARDWILRLATTYRQPEPIRRANELVNHLRSSLKSDAQ